MGIVHVAHDETLGRKVALKRLSPSYADNVQFRERFVRESRLAASIDHPNIIPVYEAGEDESGNLFIAMRLVRGRDLQQVLQDEAPLTPPRALALVAQVASALDGAHQVGLVHRDVKPGNVMIDATQTGEHCYLTDFGLVKDLSVSSGYTVTGTPLGTLTYMAPEQIEGFRLDSRADQYALGCMMFECLTGRVPFVRDSAVALMYAHMHEPPPSACALAPGLPAGVDSVLARAMAKAADDRYASCGEFVAEMRRAMTGEQMPAFEATRRVSRRFARREPAVAPETSVLPPRVEPPVPAATNGNGGNGHRAHAAYPPPAGPPRYIPPGGGASDERRWLRAAAIVACAILLTAGGIAAALILSAGGTSADAQRAAAQKLLNRTIQLNTELNREARQLRKDGEADAATRRRVAALQRKADILLADSRRQLEEPADARKALLAAQTKMKKAADQMTKAARPGAPPKLVETVIVILETVPPDIASAEGTMEQDGPIPSGQVPGVGGAGIDTSSVRLPGGELATITPQYGRFVVSMEPVGDVNGDDTSDVALSVSSGDGTSTGYVVFGGDGGDVDLEHLGDRGIQIENAWQIASAGDVNADGRDDVSVIGATELINSTGYVVFGQKDAGDVDLADLGSDGREIALPELLADDDVPFLENVNWAIRAAGDVNDDGYDDVIAGKPDEADGDGLAWVVFGSKSDADVDVQALDPTEGFSISGGNAGGLGAWVSGVGDVNGDDIDDVIVGEPYSGDLGTGGLHYAGAATVVFGSKDPHEVDVSNLGDDGFAITSQEHYAHLGTAAVGLGDVNEDGVGDLLVTAPGAGFDADKLGSGAAYVVYGSKDGHAVDVGELGSDGYAITAPAAGKPAKHELVGGLGLSASAAGDLDRDGSTDVILSSPRLRSPAAAAYVVLTGSGADDLDLADPGERAFAIEREGKAADDSALVAGDIDFDGDGNQDLVFAPEAFGRIHAYVISGDR
jgi:serine/threonine-protein kinase